MRCLLVVTVLALAACGGHARPAVSRDGRAVLRDAYDGRLDRDWSCGSLRAAVGRLPQDSPVYSQVGAMLMAAAARACDAALASLRPGMTRAQVDAALGPPDRAPRCRLYRWAPGPGTGDGARICFRGATVALVQKAAHG